MWCGSSGRRTGGSSEAALAPETISVLHSVVTAAKLGMRQGEVFGLTVDRVDFLRREVRGRPPAVDPSPPADRVRAAEDDGERADDPASPGRGRRAAAHLAEYPAGEHGLVFTLAGEPITRQAFGHVWRPVARAVGLEPGRACTLCGTTTRRF